ncbi:MAG: hypothetical protein Q8908_15755 [Bacteroidota bacterium]|nr:hypothetical protein [Bacteroidota bacterium]
MKKTIISILILMLMSTISTQAQCFSRKGIMNEACASMTIVTPPAFDVSIGFSNTHQLKVDLNYITQDEIVYGGAIGFRPYKTETNMPEITSFNGFVGYNLTGCIIVGCTAGFNRTANNYAPIDQKQSDRGSFKSNIGLSLKFISTFTHLPITFGGYANNAEIGITVGTILK